MRKKMVSILLVTLFLGGFLNFTALSSEPLPPSLTLLGSGARWAAGNGSQALYVNWKDNWLEHHDTDGADWYWHPWLTSLMDYWRSTVSATLIQYNFSVEFAADIPENLTEYDLVVLEAYYAVEPQHNQQMRDYISNGGGVVLLKGVPCMFSAYDKDLWTTTELSPIQDWFGASLYSNSCGDAFVTTDYPFGTSLVTGDYVAVDAPSGAAGIAYVNETAQIVAEWETGRTFALANEFGQGRVYYQAYFEAFSPLQWDINGDAIVDLSDITIVINLYQTTPTSQNWNPKADFNIDGVIDIADITQVIAHFGEYLPPPQTPLWETWDSLGTWYVDPRSTLVEINPAGQMHAVGGFVSRGMDFAAQFTVEFRLKVDAFGNGLAMVQIYTSQACRIFAIFADKIWLGTGIVGYEEFSVLTDNEWHVWRMLIDEDVQQTVVYRDDVLLTTFTRAEIRPLTSKVYVGADPYTTCETHWDYIYIEAPLPP